MSAKTHEQTINTALGEVLSDLGNEWIVRSEQVGRVFQEGGRPDVLVEKADGWPVVIEAEVDNLKQAEREARSRLGNHLAHRAAQVQTSVGLAYPNSIRRSEGAALRRNLTTTEFSYVIFNVDRDGKVTRFPESGAFSGNLSDLATILHRSIVPAWRVEELADSLEHGVVRAEGTFTETHPIGSTLGERIGDKLGQIDDVNGQTRRMAMTILVDALVFHAALAEAELELHDPKAAEPRTVKAPNEFRRHGNFEPTALCDEWTAILEVNYWPIFHTAREITSIIGSKLAAKLLDILWETAERLIAGGVTKSHDLTGIVFQRLIADRKFLATFYTRPAGAALLASLALPQNRPIAGTSWRDSDGLSHARIGDFACGTGTLLSTAYNRISLLHEIGGGNPKELHPPMMRDGLVGLDVLTVAVHLTAAMLAGSHPDTPFDGECLLTMPYGAHEWGTSVGSLELLKEQENFEVMQAAAETAGGRGSKEVRDLVHRVGHEQFDLVIMNPPFTRHGAREGERVGVHNPAFAAFGANEQEQNELSARLKTLARGGHAHGHAGMASYFADLAHRKVKPSGKVALVLPLTAMSGKSWDGLRACWANWYTSIIVATIAETGNLSRSFSADTGMAECLFIGQKAEERRSKPRANFLILWKQTESSLEGEMLGEQATKAIADGCVSNLEDGPLGGTPIALGNNTYGELVNCPILQDGPWSMTAVRDITLGQTAYQLTRGCFWVEGMSPDEIEKLCMTTVGEISVRTGPHDLDLTGSEIKADGLPQGPFARIAGCPKGAAYPCLWSHNTTLERQMVVAQDSHCEIRKTSQSKRNTILERAKQRWLSASKIHYNRDLQFNSQSLVVAITERPSLGGRAWPTIVFDNEEYEEIFALWANSTLGVLCHWWAAGKTQKGRGTTTVSGVAGIPSLDPGSLTEKQRRAARHAFEGLKNQRLLPIDQIDEDEGRAKIDRTLVLDVLGFDKSTCREGGPMELLRRKIAAEPQVHGDKKTKVIFTEEGERQEQRHEPR